MKSFKIPLAILIAMILLALLNGAVVEKQCRTWQQQTDVMTAHAQNGRWEEAETAFADLQESWQRWSDYLHVIMVHDEPEVVDMKLKECRVLLTQHDRDTLSLCAAQLNCQFDHLGELQSLSLSNLL